MSTNRDNKRILFITSAKEGFILDLDAWYQKQPWLPASLLYHLRERGWEIRSLNFHESWNPLKVAWILDEYRPAVVLTFFSTALSPVIARGLLAKWRGPIIFEWNDYYSEIYRAAFGFLAGIAMHLYEAAAARFSDYIFTISRYNQLRAERWGRKAWLIPLTIDKPEYDTSQCRIRLEGEFKIVHMGDADRYRKSHLLVGAMKSVPEGTRLYFIGEAKADIMKMAPSNCVFLGRLSQNDKFSVMSQADAFISSTDQDCAGKYYEYLAMKKPIIALDGRAGLLFTNGRNALLTRDFAQAIAALRESPELQRALVENAARDVALDSWKESIVKYESGLSEVIASYWESGKSNRP